MAVNKINIIVSAQNRASSTFRQATRQVKDFRSEVVRFNRNLFTATAIVATFAAGFRRAMSMADVGSQFEFVRKQFLRLFDQKYFVTLQEATRRTMDSMDMMRLAIQNHARGLSKLETQKIFTLSVGAAKVLGKSTSDAAKLMSKAFSDLSGKGMMSLLANFPKTNNQFSNMNRLISQLTKGLNSAGRLTENFRKVAMVELTRIFTKFIDTGNESIDTLMRFRSTFKNLRDVVGGFIARALAPLLDKVEIGLNFAFLKLTNILDGLTKTTKNTRQSIVLIFQTIGTMAGTLAGFVGGWGLLRIAAATFTIELNTLIGVLGLLGGAIAYNKDKNKSWLDTLGDIAAEMKFYFQAFMTYKDGISTFSGDLAKRIGGMSKESQDRILGVAKAIVSLKEIMLGFVTGAKAMVKVVGAIATSIGKAVLAVTNFLGVTNPKQFSQTASSVRKGLGAALGFGLTGAFGLNLLLKPFKSGFGMSSFFGKRGQSPVSPLYVEDVAGVGRFFAGSKLANTLGLLGSVLKGFLLAIGVFTLAFNATRAVLNKFPKTNEKLTDWGAGFFEHLFQPRQREYDPNLVQKIKDQTIESTTSERGVHPQGADSSALLSTMKTSVQKQEEGNRNTQKLIEQNSARPYNLHDDKPSRMFKGSSGKVF